MIPDFDPALRTFTQRKNEEVGEPGPQFVAGLLFGFTDNNYLNVIEDCVNQSEDFSIIADAKNLIYDLVNGDWV